MITQREPDEYEQIIHQTDLGSLKEWQYRWLSGMEYFDMIVNCQQFNQQFNFPILNDHPMSIYFTPKSIYCFDSLLDGLVYFLKRLTLKRLGFPRLEDNQKKSFKWKKMNFQTQLPKSKPKVSYIVCSTTGSKEQFRMHIVQLYQCKDSHQYLLCHLLQMETKHSQNNKIEKPLYQIARTQWLSQKVNQQALSTTKIEINHYDLEDQCEQKNQTVKKLCKNNLLLQRIRNKRQELNSLMLKCEEIEQQWKNDQIIFPLVDDEIFVREKLQMQSYEFQKNDQHMKQSQSLDYEQDNQVMQYERCILFQRGLRILQLTEDI